MSNTHTLTWTLADAIEKMRNEAGYEQEELAERSGVSRSSISNYERSKSVPPNFDTVRRIARACGFHNDDDQLATLWDEARRRRFGCIHGWSPYEQLSLAGGAFDSHDLAHVARNTRGQWEQDAA